MAESATTDPWKLVVEDGPQVRAMFPLRIDLGALFFVVPMVFFVIYGVMNVRTGETGMAIVCLVAIGAVVLIGWLGSLLRAMREHRRGHRVQNVSYPSTWMIDVEGTLTVTTATGISFRMPLGSVQRIQLKRKTAIIHGAGGYCLFLPKPIHDQHAARFRALLRQVKPAG